jgi:hypothetical protein
MILLLRLLLLLLLLVVVVVLLVLVLVLLLLLLPQQLRLRLLLSVEGVGTVCSSLGDTLIRNGTCTLSQSAMGSRLLQRKRRRFDTTRGRPSTGCSW